MGSAVPVLHLLARFNAMQTCDDMVGNIEEAVINAIARQKMLDAKEISSSLTLEELAVSSLDAITIVYEIEELFNVEVPNEKLESLRTVKDIIDGIKNLIDA